MAINVLAHLENAQKRIEQLEFELHRQSQIIQLQQQIIDRQRAVPTDNGQRTTAPP